MDNKKARLFHETFFWVYLGIAICIEVWVFQNERVEMGPFAVFAGAVWMANWHRQQERLFLTN